MGRPRGRGSGPLSPTATGRTQTEMSEGAIVPPGSVSPHALIEPGARIGANTAVGPFSVIGDDVVIGPDCWIGPHVVIKGPTRIGPGNRIFQFASVGEAPQDVKYRGEPTQLLIGARNTIREYATLHRGTVGGDGFTSVGDDNLLMAYSHIAHDCHIRNQTILANGASLAGHVVVGDFAILGGFCGVHQFCRIGDHSFTGMGTMVNRDVPPYVIAVGNYARAFGINKVGLRRRGFDPELVRVLHRAFKILIKSRGSRREALARIAPLAEAYPEVDFLVQFVRQSVRGVVR